MEIRSSIARADRRNHNVDPPNALFLQHMQQQRQRQQQEQTSNWTFAIINGPSDFFLTVKEGWEQKCRSLGRDVTCLYHSITEDSSSSCDASDRVAAMQKFIALKVHGIAIRPCPSKGALAEVFEEAYQAGIPIVTFDHDYYPPARLAFVGSDSWFMGQTMARLLRQLQPDGGTFVAYPNYVQQRYQGFKEELMKDNDRQDRSHWFERVLDNHNHNHSNNDPMQILEDLAQLQPTALITFVQTPMNHSNWTEFVDAHRNITYIGTDGADYQLEYLSNGYVNGLVGQLPHEMGSRSLQVLYDFCTQGKSPPTQLLATNLIAYNIIPLELPPLDLDENLIQHWKYMGYVCFAFVQLAAILCTVWTLYHRHSVTVKASQPFFLCLITGGVMLLSGALIPLTFEFGDDHTTMLINATTIIGAEEQHNSSNTSSTHMTHNHSIGFCMSVPWLISSGFTLIFSAIISKTMRVNIIFKKRGGRRFSRFQVTTKDVLTPLIVLMTSNILVLICWTVLDPLKYVRKTYEGTDYWNRPIATYGACRSHNPVPYIIPLGAINCLAVALASWQAYIARSIKLEFSESKYIGLTVFSFSQALLTGIPVMAVVKDMPRAYYVLITLMITLLCLAVLSLIFLPKMILQGIYSKMDESGQMQMMTETVMLSRPSFQSLSRRRMMYRQNSV